MEFRRVKNTRWQNLRATIKNFVYDYVKTHKEQLENGEPIVDDTYFETNQSTLQLFTTDDSATPAFGIISLNGVLMYLNIQLSLYENTKYYDDCKMEDESYESAIHIGDSLSDLDLEIVARLYGDAIWNAAAHGIDDGDELPKDFRDSMKICDITLKGEKVPIYLGSLYDMIDANNDWSSKLVINFYANIARRGYFNSEYMEQLVKVLMMIPYRDTREVYWVYASERSNLKMLRLTTSHNRDALQKFFMKTVLLINPDPNFIHTMFNIEIPKNVINDPSRYYRYIREFLNELSDAGINMVELVAGKNYRQLLQIEKFMDRERNVFRLADCLGGAVFNNLGRDVLERLNEFINTSVIKHEEVNNPSIVMTMKGEFLTHFGVAINSGISGTDPTIYSRLTEYMRAEDLKVESNRYNIHAVSEVMNCSTEILTCLDAMEGLILSSFKTDGADKYLIDRLSLPSFMTLMKLYVHTACYTYTDTFKQSVGAYKSAPETEGLIPLLFESFRLYFRENKNPFRYLTYVIDPEQVMNLVVRRINVITDSCCYEYDIRYISKIFDIGNLSGIRPYEQICTNNNAMIGDPNLIVQFLISGCCKQMDPMYLEHFEISANPGTPHNQTLMSYISEHAKAHRRHSDKRDAYRNDRLEINDIACDTIADTIIDASLNWPIFKRALFHIAELFPSNDVIAVFNNNGTMTQVNRNTIDPAAILFMDYLAIYHKKD